MNKLFIKEEVKKEANSSQLSSVSPFLRVKRISYYFFFTSLILLITGLVFGLIGGLQYVIPGFLKNELPFLKSRPLHVTLAISWIISAAIGGVYYYLPSVFPNRLSFRLGIAHFVFFAIGIVSIVISYMLGHFGGREYLEYPPVLSIIVGIAWILFAINFFRAISLRTGKWPVYIWMWSTGVLFFLLTYTESYLWLIPYFRDNIVRDVTVQWKSLGSMVGAWNMLIYGTAFYLMESINGNKQLAHSKQTFFLYFLGLTNLMFNWGHHTYIVPAAPFVKNVSYIISMTELLILGNIILGWRKTITNAVKNYNLFPYRFLLAADVWIFLNLILAIIISIPAINYYTHGTHITVAHAMGTTIGINTTILFASLFFILTKEHAGFLQKHKRIINFSFWLFNIGLLFFWVSLLAAGYCKAINMSPGNGNFLIVMADLQPVFRFFAVSGFFVFAGLMIQAVYCLGFYLNVIFKQNNKNRL